MLYRCSRCGIQTGSPSILVVFTGPITLPGALQQLSGSKQKASTYQKGESPSEQLSQLMAAKQTSTVMSLQ